MSEPHDLTALEQAAAVRRRELSPLELVDHYLARIDRLNATVGAYVTVAADLARVQARTAEQRLREAADPAELPALLGVPVPVKDLNPVAGVRCTLGSAVYADTIADEDDPIAVVLRDAGTVTLGKTNTPEFGLTCWTENEVAPPARTPYDLTRSAGGSSGGGAAAVAAGLAPIAHGSDGGGSVRMPASACGLVGFKPGRGVIASLGGDVAGLATHGVLAGTVRDAAALLDVLAPRPGGFLAWSDIPPGRLRIGRFRTPVIADTTVHPECVAAYDDASGLLADLGHEIVDVDPPYRPEEVPAFEAAWAVLAALVPVPPGRELELVPITRWHRERARRISGVEYARALIEMRRIERAALARLRECDAILTPTIAQPPALVGALRDDDDPGRGFELEKAFTPFASAWNVTGQSAVSLPLHWTAQGLPIGVMLAGRRGGDGPLIALAAQLEAVRPWRDRRPDVR